MRITVLLSCACTIWLEVALAGDANALSLIRVVDCVDSNSVHVLRMMPVKSYIKIESDQVTLRLDLTVEYEDSIITFLNAKPVNQLLDWEYFTWRHTVVPDCGANCRNQITVTAIADLADTVDNHPDPSALVLDGRVVFLEFMSTQNNNLIFESAPIDLVSDSCGGVVLHGTGPDSIHVPIGSNMSCFGSVAVSVLEDVQTFDGRVWVYAPPDDWGDLNLNDYLWDVGDVVVFNRYLEFGNSVWDPVWDNYQILSTDVNHDGQIGTVEDFRHLIRIIAKGTWSTVPGGDCW